jgi:hypothetical protein
MRVSRNGEILAGAAAAALAPCSVVLAAAFAPCIAVLAAAFARGTAALLATLDPCAFRAVRAASSPSALTCNGSCNHSHANTAVIAHTSANTV